MTTLRPDLINGFVEGHGNGFVEGPRQWFLGRERQSFRGRAAAIVSWKGTAVVSWEGRGNRFVEGHGFKPCRLAPIKTRALAPAARTSGSKIIHIPALARRSHDG